MEPNDKQSAAGYEDAEVSDPSKEGLAPSDAPHDGTGNN